MPNITFLTNAKFIMRMNHFNGISFGSTTINLEIDLPAVFNFKGSPRRMTMIYATVVAGTASELYIILRTSYIIGTVPCM